MHKTTETKLVEYLDKLNYQDEHFSDRDRLIEVSLEAYKNQDSISSNEIKIMVTGIKKEFTNELVSENASRICNMIEDDMDLIEYLVKNNNLHI